MLLLSWSLLGKSSTRTSVTSAQLNTTPALSTYIHEQDWTKRPPQRALSHLWHSLPFQCIPLPFFHSSRFEVFRWFLSRKQTAGRIQPWVTPCGRRAAATTQACNTRSISLGGSTDGPNRDLAQTQKSHCHMLFSVTELVPSPFHHTEQQTLLTLALLLQEALVGRQLEVTPYFSRVTKSRPWLPLLPAPL